MHNSNKCCVAGCRNISLINFPECSDHRLKDSAAIHAKEQRDIAIITGKPLETINEANAKSQKDNFAVDLNKQQSLSYKYPKYYKAIPEGMKEIDVYGVHRLFNIQDPSGALQHASKKLLLSGARTGGKSMYQDIKEARDTLNRWLELHPET